MIGSEVKAVSSDGSQMVMLPLSTGTVQLSLGDTVCGQEDDDIVVSYICPLPPPSPLMRSPDTPPLHSPAPRAILLQY